MQEETMSTVDDALEGTWSREVSDPALEGAIADLVAGQAAQAIEKVRALLRGRDPLDPAQGSRRLVLGVALVETGDLVLAREAVRILADAASWAQRAGFKAALAEARLQGGRARASQGEHHAALAGIEAALADYEAIKDQGGIARTRVILGRLRAAVGDPGRGAKDLLEAAQAYARLGAKAEDRAR